MTILIFAITTDRALYRNNKSIYIAPIESTAQPFEIPLAKGGDAFWLDARTVAHAVDEGEGKDKVKAQMKICHAFIDAILEEVLARKRESSKQSGEKDDVQEGETLLEHLVNYTEGKVFFAV